MEGLRESAVGRGAVKMRFAVDFRIKEVVAINATMDNTYGSEFSAKLKSEYFNIWVDFRDMYE
jgi:hypothetical protein